MDDARALLDQLMGKDRNESLTAKKEKTLVEKWRDADLCKFYLLDFCPHDLFFNCRADLGKCPLVHSDILKEEFAKATGPDKERDQERFELEFLRYLDELVTDIDARIKRATDRLARASSITADVPNTPEITRLQQRIRETISEAEEAAEAGNLELSTDRMNHVATLNEELKMISGDNYKKFQVQGSVCQVCGVQQGIGEGDINVNVNDHIQGKQHVGYVRIREAHANLMKKHRDRFRGRAGGSRTTDAADADRKRKEDPEDDAKEARERLREKEREMERDTAADRDRDRERRGKERWWEAERSYGYGGHEDRSWGRGGGGWFHDDDPRARASKKRSRHDRNDRHRERGRDRERERERRTEDPKDDQRKNKSEENHQVTAAAAEETPKNGVNGDHETTENVATSMADE